MPGISDILLSVPPVTRFFLIVTVAVSLGVSLDVISTGKLMFHPPFLLALGYTESISYFTAFKRALPQSYRLFTSFLVVDGIKDNGVRVILNIYRFYTFSEHLENSRGKFRGNFPDYLWFVLVSGGLLVGINWVFNSIGFSTFFHHSQLLSCITFLWLRTSMNSLINFMGLVPIKAYYLPLCDVGMSIISGDNHPADPFAGILAGYFYECIQSDTLPIYNLLPGAYGSRNGLLNNGRRVGFNVDTSISPNAFTQSIFDLGYWKAPNFFYRLLKYPTNTLVRTTAFARHENYASQEASAAATGLSGAKSFKGEGRRLGG